MQIENSLFHTEVVNQDGVDGKVYVKNGGLSVTVSSPTSKDPGTNPEELLGMSLSTCLNATIKAILKGRGLENESTVEVHVDFVPEPSGGGYFFEVMAYAQIKEMPFENAQRIVQQAEKRCPVSKLLQGSSTVEIKTIA